MNEPREESTVHRLADLLPPPRIIELPEADKRKALQALLDVLSVTGAIPRRVDVERAIFSREVLMSTGVGYGIAVPHARLESVPEFALALGVHEKGMPYSSVIDDQPVRMICMIVGPSGRHSEYLRILAMVMRFLKQQKGKILSAYTLDAVHRFTEGYDTSEGGPGD